MARATRRASSCAEHGGQTRLLQTQLFQFPRAHAGSNLNRACDKSRRWPLNRTQLIGLNIGNISGLTNATTKWSPAKWCRAEPLLELLAASRNGHYELCKAQAISCLKHKQTDTCVLLQIRISPHTVEIWGRSTTRTFSSSAHSCRHSSSTSPYRLQVHLLVSPAPDSAAWPP